MIPIQELRVGCYYKSSIVWDRFISGSNPSGEPTEFILTEAKLKLILQFAPKSYEWIYPVEIDKDWLLKFNFEFAAGSYYPNGDRYSKFRVEKQGSRLLFFYGQEETKDTRYIHQLQILYSALTNKELIIK